MNYDLFRILFAYIIDAYTLIVINQIIFKEIFKKAVNKK